MTAMTRAGKWVFLAIATGWLFLPCAGAQETGKAADSEYSIKAACIYNFLKFVDWPGESFASGKSPIVIGVIGNTPLGKVLDDVLAGKTVQDRKIDVVHFKGIDDLPDIGKRCHLLFVPVSEKDSLNRIFSALKESSVLTIGETAGFCEKGGIINFHLKDDKIRFDVNTAAAGQAKVRISSKLLKLASSVITKQAASTEGGSAVQ